MDTNILLENGTNELEVLEFALGDKHYGINVAKISEILSYQPVTPIPNSEPEVEGIFMPRDTMITVIDLSLCLGFESSGEGGLFIITNFNKLNIAFHVDEVFGIHRVSWTEIIKPDQTVNANENGVSTGIIKMDDKLIIVLDFEKIVSDINPETGLRVSQIDEIGERDRSDATILLAEDSPLLSKLIQECLKKAGYVNINVNSDGKEAWDALCAYKEAGTLRQNVDLIITDIEMPKMDGHRLTKLVKEDEDMKGIPLIIFSSLVNDEMRRKGEQLGANAQLSKPEIGQLVEAIDRLIAEARSAQAE